MRFLLIFIGVILFGYKLDLSSGWQLNGALEDINIKSFNNQNIESVWTYQNGKWELYLPNNSDMQKKIIDENSDIKSLTSIKKGEGFWVFANSDISLEVNCLPKFAPFYPVGSEKIDLNSSFIYSFIVTDGNNCIPYWDWAMGEDFKKFEIKKDGIISFGGAGADKKSLAYVCDEKSLFSAYKNILDSFKIEWIDFDIEGKMLDENSSNIKRFKVLKKLQNSYNIKISLTLPVMPYGFDEKVMNLIKLAYEFNLSIASYNLMLMDYGEEYPANDKNKTLMFEYSKSAIESANKNLKQLFSSKDDFYDKIGAVPMIGVNDVTNEIFYKEDFFKLKNYVYQKEMPLFSFWSILRDRRGKDLDTSSGLNSKEYGEGSYQYFKIGKCSENNTN